MAETATITLHVSPSLKRRADAVYGSRGTTTARALTDYLTRKVNIDEGNRESEQLVQRLLAAVDDVKTNPDGGIPMDTAFAEIREKLYKDEPACRVKDTKEHPGETIPMEQAFVELRREFSVAE